MIDYGTVMRNERAAFELTGSANCVTRSTGMPAGLVPSSTQATIWAVRSTATGQSMP